MYLRIPRVAFFLITTCLCIAEIGLAAWSVADAHDKQKLVKHTLPTASLDVSDALAVGGAVTAAAALSTLLCLGLLFFTVFKPRQAETLTSVRIKEGCFAIIILLWIGTLIPATYYTATRSGIIRAPGIPQSLIDQLVKASGQNLSYNHQRPILSYLIVGWIAFLSTIISLILVSIAARKTLKYGPDGTGPLEMRQHINATNTATPAESARPSTAIEKPATGLHSTENHV